MAQDPAFLFYPGDYLRDTQVLSEAAQVAYDRIMCEHMRNICLDMSNIGVSQKRVKFFTKKLNDDEKEEIENVLVKSGDLLQIVWVAESISKRRKYSESRRSNRKKGSNKPKKHMLTYDEHKENENENVIEDENKEENENEKFAVSKTLKFQTDFKKLWGEYFPAQLLASDDIENINALKRKISDQIKEKKKKEGHIGYNPQNDEILDGIRFILRNLPDFWKDKIDVKKLGNNLNSIIQQIISDNGQQPRNGSNITISEQARRAALKEIINRAAAGELKMD